MTVSLLILVNYKSLVERIRAKVFRAIEYCISVVDREVTKYTYHPSRPTVTRYYFEVEVANDINGINFIFIP